MHSVALASMVLLAPDLSEVGEELHVEPTALYLDPTQWVAVAMLAVFGVMFWAKFHKAVAAALDEKIDHIRKQLDEARSLREEAETLRDEYAAKTQALDKDREAMLVRAGKEADEIVAKAEKDAEALIARRQRMAEDKIAAEERQAVDQLRSVAATAATRAAARLIAERHDPAVDATLVDQAIAEIGTR